jgi:hypothetical protein
MTKKRIDSRIVTNGGFTFLELQISVMLLAISVMGLTRLAITGLRQLEWLEKGNQLYSYIPQDASKMIVADLRVSGDPSPAAWQLATIESLEVHASSAAAVVTLAPVGG